MQPGQLIRYKGRGIEVWFPVGIRDFAPFPKVHIGCEAHPTSTEPGTISSGLKRPRREADCWSPSTTEVKNYGAILPLPHKFPWCHAKVIKYREIGVGMWGLWWTKRHWGRFSPSTSVSPANHDSTNFSIIIITRGGTIGILVTAVPSGPNGIPPPHTNFKKKYSENFTFTTSILVSTNFLNCSGTGWLHGNTET
jgi:hypothetical protein